MRVNIHKNLVKRLGNKARKYSRASVSVGKTASKKTIHNAKKATISSVRHVKKIPQTITYQKAHKTYKKAHYKYARLPHEHMMQTSKRYAAWHSWRYKRLHHGHIHFAALALYILFIGILVFNQVGLVFAADLSDNWDFSTPSNFSFDSGIETSGSSARLKPQEYTSDDDTAALYHMNESSGSTLDDSSANNNDATTSGSPTFASGNMNNALSLNGANQYASVPDSSSLSLGSQQTVEGWIKPGSTFNTSSTGQQTIFDKGSSRMYLDNTSGKLAYELQNNSATSWNRVTDSRGQNNGWNNEVYYIESSVMYNGDLYVGTTYTSGTADVWKRSGGNWTRIGGDGLNSSWSALTYEGVYSLAVLGTDLYAGLGANAADAEVWKCSLASNCTSWSKIGGDNTGLTTNHETVRSMVVYQGALYVGAGDSAGDADVYRYNGGTSWTQVGGDGLNSSWAASTFERVQTMTSDGTYLYAGLGVSAGDAEVWRYNGSTWTRIGGDTVNSSWADTTYEFVYSLTTYGGNVYAGLGQTAGDGEVWRWNGSSWSQIGGDTVNSSWANSTYEFVTSLENDGTNLYAGLGSSSGDAEVWKWNGSTWTKVGGDGVNNSFGGSANTVYNLRFDSGSNTLFAGVTNGVGAYEWSFDGSTWTLVGGNAINGSWANLSTSNVMAMTNLNGKQYIALGETVSSAMVYEYDGNSYNVIGGPNINNGWSYGLEGNYETVQSLVAYNGALYAGLGTSSGDGEVWRWNGSTWSQVGGDSLNSSWSTAQYINAMAVWNGKLYAAVYGGGANGYIYEYNGSTWVNRGGGTGNVNGITSGAYSGAVSLTNYNDRLCVGFSANANQADVWCWTGSGNWTQVGGDGLNSSWNSSDTAVWSMSTYNGNLVVGVADETNRDAMVWSYNGSTWTKIGGGSVNSSWNDVVYYRIYSFVTYNGELYAAFGYGANNGHIWKWNGSTWTQVGGDGLNSSWSTTIENVRSLGVFKGKLYAGLGASSGVDAQIYSLGNNAYVESSTTSFDTNWKHIAATYDGTTAKLYINGTQDGSAATPVTTTDNSLPLLIGSGYGGTMYGYGSSLFNGSLDEFRFSNIVRPSFTTKPYTDTNQAITLAGAVRKSGVASWDGLSANETSNGGTITYRLSDDDATSWKYWNGSSWAVSNSLNDANDISTINANIGDFTIGFDGIRWQAILKGDGTQRVQLDSVTLTANSDADEPNNATNIIAYKSNGGDEITNNAWTNSPTPYFTWTAGSDSGAGLLGYCLYLGTSSSADPVITKGLLGTGNVNNGGNCQFSISSNSIDLSTSGMLATALTTSNNPYYLNIKAIDKAGNISANSVQFQFRFDNTAPSNPGFITAPSQFVANKEVTFTWPTAGGDAASDDNSGLAGLQYRIGATSSWYGDGTNGDGLLANDGSYTTRNNPDYANINEGNNTVYFRTWDQAGNVTTSYATAALKLNTSSPSSPQNISPSPPSNTENNFSFSWDPPASYTGSLSAMTYCYTINTNPTVNTCTFTAPGVTSIATGAFATQPGENTIYVVAKDEAGNINYATAGSATFTANTSAPGIPLDIDIADVSIKSTSSWKLALTWNRPTNIGAGIASYRVLRSTDNTNFSQVASTSGTSYVDSGLDPVRYYYKVKACDSANNCGAFSSVVNLIPTGKFTSPANLTAQPSVSGISTKKAVVKWATDRESDSKISIGTKSGQYQPFQVASDDQVTDHRVELNNLTPGTTYFMKASWTDEDGNVGNSTEFSFKTDPAPSTQEVLTSRITLSSAQIRFTSISAAKVVVQYGKSDNFGGVKEIATSLSKSTYDVEITGLDDGSKYFYRLNTYDAEGNEYVGSTVLTFTTPARPRIENLRFQPVEGEPTSTQKITWRTNVATSSLIRFTPKGGAGKEVSSSKLVVDHEIVIRDLLDDTEYTFVAESRDKDGNLAVSDIQSLRTAQDTRPPKISDVTVETSIKGTGAEARGQVVVSWKTDEPSSSQVAYAEGSNATEFNNKSTEDAVLALEHIVIVSDLPTSRVYSIQPISKDKSGNNGTGETKSAIIGRASDSVITIVLNTLRKVFGF